MKAKLKENQAETEDAIREVDKRLDRIIEDMDKFYAEGAKLEDRLQFIRRKLLEVLSSVRQCSIIT